jgi:hypothetical protein
MELQTIPEVILILAFESRAGAMKEYWSDGVLESLHVTPTLR